eukprot:TRINITY_DN17108_c0_g3_i1.p1 TRINITY_DN17108_c0_g3~~TRINITY_DN17108_c0_g3_i1.p1  ORF type:complete len:103 (+),score=10.74 TRINITY_DN17108_c0_g3_i1:133-441(+)
MGASEGGSQVQIEELTVDTKGCGEGGGQSPHSYYNSGGNHCAPVGRRVRWRTEQKAQEENSCRVSFFIRSSVAALEKESAKADAEEGKFLLKYKDQFKFTNK